MKNKIKIKLLKYFYKSLNSTQLQYYFLKAMPCGEIFDSFVPIISEDTFDFARQALKSASIIDAIR